MGTGYRVFFFDENDTIRPIPVSKFNRLTKGDSSECLEEYAGKKVRYALVMLSLEDRVPIKTIHIEYSILPFDEEGCVDRDEIERMMQLSMESVGEPRTVYMEDNVVQASHLFAKKKLHNEFKWKPTPEMEVAIRKKIWG